MGAAAGSRTLADIVEYCDGWMPLATRHDIAGQIERVRTAIAEAGRNAEVFEVSAYAAKTHQVEDLTAAGVDRTIFSLPALGADVVIPKLDEWASQLGL
jgi:alkanesulfonate monooxygenase SsuD/methylene tetrahydromethanopterin reductase-like flavin-dependent oxidoreductase (luciferase family)